MFLFRRKKNDDEGSVDLNARSPQLGIKYKDLLVLGQLHDHGADLTKPREATYFLYFTSEEVAEAGATEARTAGYTSAVRHLLPEDPGRWSLVCERSDVVLDPPAVRAADDLFQAIADRHGGDFDGWEAAATP